MKQMELEAYFDAYATTIYRYCVMFTKNHHDAQDCTQEAFIKLSKEEVMTDDTHVRNWLYMVARNECMSLLRKNWYRKTVIDSEIINQMPNYETAEEISLLMYVPKKYREILYLYYYEGYSQGEIAHLLGISIDAVKKTYGAWA